jgi:hypothetical protein
MPPLSEGHEDWDSSIPTRIQTELTEGQRRVLQQRMKRLKPSDAPQTNFGDALRTFVFTTLLVTSIALARVCVEPPAPPGELRYIATLIRDPTYRNPGNLVQQLSTQPGDEARNRPARMSILGPDGKQYFYKVRY